MVKARLDDPLTAAQLRSLLDYDPETGIFTWRPRRVLTQYDKTWNARYAGTKAGTPTVPKGYTQIMVNGRLYLAQRLAFLWMTGEWPKSEEIDHFNEDRADNRFSNLREATSSQNKWNTGNRADNSSGSKGVAFDKRRGTWYARIEVNGTKTWLGSFATIEDAKAARDAAARRLHGEFHRTN